MNTELLAKIQKCPDLPSLPAIAIQILEVSQRPTVDMSEIAKVISQDPAICSKILRTVNSSYYARAHTISTISNALVVLGLQSVKTLVLTFSLVANLTKRPANGFVYVSYWKRSLYAATSAKTIAAAMHLVQLEEAFLGALLADIGMLVLETVIPDEYGQLYSQAASHAQLVELEQQKLGMTHADVGGYLAEQWGLPPVLSVPIGMSHNPTGIPESAMKRLTELVELAGFCAEIFIETQAERQAESIAKVRQFAAARCQMTDQECDGLINDISERTKEMANLFEINIGSYGDYKAILANAQQLLEKMPKTQVQKTIAAKVDRSERRGLVGVWNRLTRKSA